MGCTDTDSNHNPCVCGRWVGTGSSANRGTWHCDPVTCTPAEGLRYQEEKRQESLELYIRWFQEAMKKEVAFRIKELHKACSYGLTNDALTEVMADVRNCLSEAEAQVRRNLRQ